MNKKKRGMFKERKRGATGTRGEGADKHEERAIKPGFRRAFMGSETQTPFEVARRFQA